ALPAGRRRALRRSAGWRPLPPAARDLGPAAARGRLQRGRRGARRLQPLRRRRRRAGGARRAARGIAPARRDDRHPHPRRRDPARPRPPRRSARPRRLPCLLHLRLDLPPRSLAALRGRRRRGRAVIAAPSREPTPEQAAAIAVRGDDVLLEAGAGTGKTGVMVERYCRLVCDSGLSPDAVLAFTFPDNAAAGLREWSPAELARRAERGSERAASVLAGIGGAWVTTIHGFCNRVLAAHPVAA